MLLDKASCGAFVVTYFQTNLQLRTDLIEILFYLIFTNKKNIMNVEDISEYCLSKNGTSEDFPFDEETLVFKVMGKMFALIPLERIPFQINLKCDPELTVELRERYEAVQPGYHMNKSHWNTILIDGSLRKDLILEWIDLSYGLVVSGLKKSEKEKLMKQA